MNTYFPERFVWGAGSSAYQIEGGAADEGRGPSVWDTFCKREGAIHAGHTGSVACDHFRRWREDVVIMRQLGLHAYRFSVSWPRVMPQGVGEVNARGIGFYDRLVDELLAADIQPWITLFHWDFPDALYLRGGWLNRDSARWFAEYTRVVVEALSDRVSNWITINEPQIFIGHGHATGGHAPGLKLPPREYLLAGHHALLAHGHAAQTIRAHAKTKPSVGWATCGAVEYPATDAIPDIEAAYRATMSVVRKDCWNNTWWADPVCLGAYPEDGLRLFGADAPRPARGDMEMIRQPLDFYGVNIYSGSPVRAGKDGRPEPVPLPPGHPTTSFRWPVTPQCLYWGPRFLHQRYHFPIVLTENGMSNNDWVHADGRVHDAARIDFTRAYLLELGRAIADGVDVRGYFHWSILDNFEWAEGFRERFGMVHVDYSTLERTPKDSAYWYRDIIASHGGALQTPWDNAAASLQLPLGDTK